MKELFFNEGSVFIWIYLIIGIYGFYEGHYILSTIFLSIVPTIMFFNNLSEKLCKGNISHNKSIISDVKKYEICNKLETIATFIANIFGLFLFFAAAYTIKEFFRGGSDYYPVIIFIIIAVISFSINLIINLVIDILSVNIEGIDGLRILYIVFAIVFSVIYFTIIIFY